MRDLEQMKKELRQYFNDVPLVMEAVKAIEELQHDLYKYKTHSENISKLPGCNTCAKKKSDECSFMPRIGDYERINCAFYVPDPREVRG